MNLTGKIINSCYFVKEKLGEGTYTVNWYAKSIFSDFHVVLKFLKDANPAYDAGALARLKAEVYKTFNTYHAAIEKILEVDEYENHTYIAAERINGVMLEEYGQKKADLPLEDAVYIAIKICQALEYLHARDIVHKNLNPSDIWLITHLDQIQSIKISDFAFLEFEELTHKKNRANMDWCMAPEVVLRDREKINRTSDIFSAGCLLYRLLTQTVPHGAGAKLPAPPSALNEKIPPFLDFIVLKALHPRQDKRYPDAGMMCGDLIRFNTQGAAALPEENIEPGRPAPDEVYAADEASSPTPQSADRDESAAEEETKAHRKRKKPGREIQTGRATRALKPEDYAFFKKVLKGGKSDLEYLKKQFYRLVNYHGNILILENLTHEYLQLLEYFKDFLAYNNSIMLNFDCLSRRDDNSLYFFMLAAYLKYLAEHNVRPKKIKKIVQKKFPAETAKLILFAPELRSLFGNTTIKPRFTAARQNRPSPAAEFIELLRDFCTRKNSMALVLRNIQHIDEMSKKLLFYTDRHLNSLPVLILGILS